MSFKFAHLYSARESDVVFPSAPSATLQCFKDDCDVNSIISRYPTTSLASFASAPPVYGDFSEKVDRLQLHSVISSVESYFASLPLEERLKFGNDPIRFLSEYGLSSVQEALSEDSSASADSSASTDSPASNDAGSNDGK